MNSSNILGNPPTTRSISACGLPKFRPGELAALKAEGYAAILVLDVGGAIVFGVSGDPNKFTRDITNKKKRPTIVRHMSWAPDAALAHRIKGRAQDLVCDRRISRSDAFDLPEHFAIAAIDIAAGQVGVNLATTDELLSRGDVRRARHRAKAWCH